VEAIANDRAASEPDPRAVAGFRCPPGQRRVEDEARALASRRLMALAALGDRARWETTAADPREPALVRAWVRRFLRGRPDAWRERHIQEEIRWHSVRAPDAMPCVGKFPGGATSSVPLP
jgi:hypothetical protein